MSVTIVLAISPFILSKGTNAFYMKNFDIITRKMKNIFSISISFSIFLSYDHHLFFPASSAFPLYSMALTTKSQFCFIFYDKYFSSLKMILSNISLIYYFGVNVWLIVILEQPF